MAAAIKVLAEALRAELATLTGKTWQRRYAPYYLAEEVAQAKYFLIGLRNKNDIAARTVERTELTIVLGMQQALPDATAKEDDFIENTAWLDARVDEFETIKALFRPGGVLRNKFVANCEFKSMQEDLVYLPEQLLDHSMFATMVELVYEFETEGSKEA